ncbi:hypothetical protein J2853_007489 [Streptosporangium lutulentum]|uniref:Uncharacterized protein n=1 Tax=Streptosporangium lutulentum TaxID=1461250 RepID=A0ABT9QNG9_9ACTN|nr:hypothetical protein [Streptosporangium lutulentum]
MAGPSVKVLAQLPTGPLLLAGVKRHAHYYNHPPAACQSTRSCVSRITVSRHGIRRSAPMARDLAIT